MSLIESLGPWMPLVVFLATFGESAAFLGLIVPGETVALAGGALAAIHGRGPVPVLVAAVIGAVAGDAVGFHLGRRYGLRLADHPRLRRYRVHLDRARDYVERRGIWALVLARFASVLRAVVPFSAGTAGMGRWRFFTGNVIGGVVWGVGVAGLGYLAGTRWHVVEGWLSRIGVTVAVIGLLVGGVALAARWAGRNPERIRRALVSTGRIPVVGAALRGAVRLVRHGRTVVRVGTHVVAAAVATAVFVIAGSADWSFAEGRILLDVTGADAAVIAGASRAAAIVVPAVALIAAAAAFGSGLRLRLALIATSMAVAGSVAGLVAWQVHRPTVDLPGLGPSGPFPDLFTAIAAVALLASGWPLDRGWIRGVRVLGMSVGAMVAVGGIRVVSLAARPVDVVAGMALGMAAVVWVAVALDPRLGGTTLPRSWTADRGAPSGGEPAPSP